MSLEQAVVQLEQTNAALQEEVVRFRDSAMGFFNIYPTITAGRQAVADGAYFSVPGNGAYMRLYRRQGSSASLIAEYPSRESMVDAINEATADAEARADAAADRAEVYADNKGFVALERFRKQATLDLDFGAGDYSLDDGDKLRTTNADDLLTVERATPKWVEGPNGKLREVPPNTIAREWRNSVPQGVLIESSATNLLLWSEDFSKANWAKLKSTTTSSVSESPNGSLTADKLIEDLTEGEHYVEQEVSSFPSSGTFTFSVFAKAGEHTSLRFRPVHVGANQGDTSNINFILEEGRVGGGLSGSEAVKSASIRKMGNGWYLCSATIEVTGTVTSLRHRIQLLSGESPTSYQGDGQSGVYIWGAGLEIGSTATSYIPTTDSPVTRAADKVYRDLGGEFNASEVSWLIEEDVGNPSGYLLEMAASLNPNSNRILLRRSSVGYEIYVINEGVSSQLSIPASLDGAARKVAISIRPTGASVAVAGEPPHSLLAEVPSLAGVGVGQRAGGAGGYAGGAIKQFIGFPRALTAAELQEITA